MNPSRISIRPFKLFDADDLLTWANDQNVTHYFRWNSIISKEEALNHIQQVAIPHPWHRSICLDDRSIGYIGIKLETGNYKHRAYVGYALKLAIPCGFEEFPCLIRLGALVDEENIGSQRVLEKVGFVREGFLRKYAFNKSGIGDMYIYNFLRSDIDVYSQRRSHPLQLNLQVECRIKPISTTNFINIVDRKTSLIYKLVG